MIDFNHIYQFRQFHMGAIDATCLMWYTFLLNSIKIQSKQTYVILILVKWNIVSYFKQMDLTLQLS
jgi:hypothetical protein